MWLKSFQFKYHVALKITEIIPGDKIGTWLLFYMFLKRINIAVYNNSNKYLSNAQNQCQSRFIKENSNKNNSKKYESPILHTFDGYHNQCERIQSPITRQWVVRFPRTVWVFIQGCSDRNGHPWVWQKLYWVSSWKADFMPRTQWKRNGAFQGLMVRRSKWNIPYK